MTGMLDRAALVVVDVQNAFCAAEGSVARSGLDHEPMAAVVPAVVQLASTAREAGLLVVLTRYVLAPDGSDDGLLFEVAPALGGLGSMERGSWDAELVGGLEQPGDLVLDKKRYSAFWRTGLLDVLKGRGVDTVIICGVTTNVCVEGTARDAFAHDLHVIVAADATAAVTTELHHGSLSSMGYGVGTITSVDAICASLEPAVAR